MSQLTFAKATKKQAKARLAFAGPSGSGKTYTSLLVARVLGRRVALIDTEHRSASKYADEFDFDTLPLDRYDPQVLIQALAVAGQAAYDVAVVDSLSHFWMGTDGMLEQVDRAAKRVAGGNSFGGWKEMRPVERQMIEAMLAYPGHVIVTMRTKTEYVVEKDDRGRSVPRKIGLKPEQRDGLEYEFDIVGDLDLENELIVSKSRCKALSGAVLKKPGEDFARTVAAWLDDGVAGGPTAAQLRDEALDPYATFEELRALYRRAQDAALLGAPVVDDTGEGTTLGELVTARGRTARAAAPPPGADGAPSVTQVQHRRMHALWRDLRLGGEDHRERRLARTSEIVARPVDSSATLTSAEADKVIAVLERDKAELAQVGVRP